MAVHTSGMIPDTVDVPIRKYRPTSFIDMPEAKYLKHRSHSLLTECECVCYGMYVQMLDKDMQ